MNMAENAGEHNTGPIEPQKPPESTAAPEPPKAKPEQPPQPQEPKPKDSSAPTPNNRAALVDELKSYQKIVEETLNPQNLQRKGASKSLEKAKTEIAGLMRKAANAEYDPAASEVLNLLFNGVNEILVDSEGKEKYKLSDESLFYIYPAIDYLIKQPNATLFSKEGEPETQFESLLRGIYHHYDSSYRTLKVAFTNASEMGGARSIMRGLTKAEVEEHLQKIEDEEHSRSIERSNRSGSREQELVSLLDYLEGDIEGQKLARAIYDPPEFLSYMSNLYHSEDGFFNRVKNELRRDHPEYSEQQLDAEAKPLADQQLSFEMMDRIRRMAAQLFKRAYTTDIEMTYSESLTKGNPFRNPRTVAEDLKNMLNNLAQVKFDDREDIKSLKFYQFSMKEMPMRIPRMQKDKTFDYEEKVLYVPIPNPDQVTGFYQFMLTVTQAVLTEDESGEVLHDIISISSRVPGAEYWQTLQKYAEQKLGSAEVDAFNGLFDQDPIRFASVLEQKLQELELAKFDWMLKPTVGQPDPDTKLTPVDRYTQDYIIKRYRKIFEEAQWRIYRALSLARGDQAGITLTRATLPALADPDLEAGMSPTFSSPSQKMYPAYTVMNWGGMQGTRWMSAGSTRDSTIFGIVEGKGVHRVLGHWEHTKRFEELDKVKRSFKHGKNKQDVKEENIRFFEILNMGKIGSIYDRGGWRDYLMYEGWLVREDAEVDGTVEKNGRVNVLKSWKALENIGTEMLKDFIGNIERQEYNFFTANENSSRRKELIKYLYERYMVNPYEQKTDTEIAQEIDTLFGTLEEEKPDLANEINGFAPLIPRKKAYDTFFYQVITRALAQQIPTKFIRLESERRRKVSEERDRMWDEVYKIAETGVTIPDLKPSSSPEIDFINGELQPAPILSTGTEVEFKLSTGIKTEEEWAKDPISRPQEETYYSALQDICFAETIIMEEGNQILDEHFRRHPTVSLHDVDLSKIDNLTPQRLHDIFTRKHKNAEGKYVFDVILDDDPQKDIIRKRNALTVLESTRKFLYTTRLNDEGKILDNEEARTGSGKLYLDEFARIYSKGAPYAPPIAIGVERLRRHLLAHKAAGADVPKRAIGDLVTVEKEVIGNIAKVYEGVEHMAHDGKTDKLIEPLQKIQQTLYGIHGYDTARPVIKWNLYASLPIILKDTSARHWWGAFRTTHASIISEKKSGYVGKFKEFDALGMHHLLTELQENNIFPADPYDTHKAPTMVPTFALSADGKSFKRDAEGNLIKGKDEIRIPDFKDVGHEFEHILIAENPGILTLKKLLPIVPLFLILYALGIINKAYDAENKSK